MNKRAILLAVLGVLGIAIGYVIYTFATTKSHSPKDTVTQTLGDAKLEVVYCRPYKKGRTIFGTKDEGALQPYGVYWRAGANEATTIELSEDIVFGGKPLNAGKYSLYVVPDQDNWTIGINSEWDRWGYSEVDHNKDVLQVQVPVEPMVNVMEQFTINFTQEGEALMLNLMWDQSSASVPISAM